LRQLKDCDSVVTNPPFSKFHKFMEILVKSNKKFVIIGNLNAVVYKQFFPLILSNKVWLGADTCKGAFIRPDGGESKLGFAVWFTNMKHNRREKDKIKLTEKYTGKAYPRYDNYDAVEVAKVENIPDNYHGVMGVPVNFLQKHNPRQFEIVGSNRGVGQDPNGVYGRGSKIKGRETFKRIFIKKVGAKAGWRETKDLTKRSSFGDAGGFIYVAVVPGDKDWYKIGKTNTSVAERVKRDAFNRKKPEVVMSLEVVNATMAEKQIHDALGFFRDKGTEFFKLPQKELERVLGALAGKRIKLWSK